MIQQKVYIPLQHKTTRVGVSHWFRPPTGPFHVEATNTLVSEKLHGSNASASQAKASAKNPNATSWNIGCVGSSRIGAHIGHVDVMLFVSISFALGSKLFQWNMGLHIASHNAGAAGDSLAVGVCE